MSKHPIILTNRLYRHTDKTMQKIDKQKWLNTVDMIDAIEIRVKSIGKTWASQL
jgi:hypothetical protein